MGRSDTKQMLQLPEDRRQRAGGDCFRPSRAQNVKQDLPDYFNVQPADFHLEDVPLRSVLRDARTAAAAEGKVAVFDLDLSTLLAGNNGSVRLGPLGKATMQSFVRGDKVTVGHRRINQNQADCMVMMETIVW